MTEPGDRDRVKQLLNDWYPCTILLLGDRVDRVLDQFCTDALKARNDASSLAEHILTLIRAEIEREPGLLPYSRDVATYEAAVAVLAVSEAARLDTRLVADPDTALLDGHTGLWDSIPIVGRHVRVNTYGYNIPAIIVAIEECDRLEPVDRPETCHVLLVARADEPKPVPILISDGIEMLLALSDGTRSVAAIVQALRDRLGATGADDVDRRAYEAIEMLRAKHVLT